jgi:hypothetical protein
MSRKNFDGESMKIAQAFGTIKSGVGARASNPPHCLNEDDPSKGELSQNPMH